SGKNASGSVWAHRARSCQPSSPSSPSSINSSVTILSTVLSSEISVSSCTALSLPLDDHHAAHATGVLQPPSRMTWMELHACHTPGVKPNSDISTSSRSPLGTEVEQVIEYRRASPGN